MTHRIFEVPFGEIYDLYVAKVERKGQSAGDVDTVIQWLTGFTVEQLRERAVRGDTLRQFFDDATINPAAALLRGSVCGVKIQEVEDPLMRHIRYMDKLVDDVAKGRALERMLPKLPD